MIATYIIYIYSVSKTHQQRTVSLSLPHVIQTYSLQLHPIALGQLILHHDVTTAVVITHLNLVCTTPRGLSVLLVLLVMWIMTIK